MRSGCCEAFGPWPGVRHCTHGRAVPALSSPLLVPLCQDGIHNDTLPTESMFCQKYGKEWMRKEHAIPLGGQQLGTDVRHEV